MFVLALSKILARFSAESESGGGPVFTLSSEAMSDSFLPSELPGENQIQFLKLQSRGGACQVLQKLSLHALLPFRGSPLMAQDFNFLHVYVYGTRGRIEMAILPGKHPCQLLGSKSVLSPVEREGHYTAIHSSSSK